MNRNQHHENAVEAMKLLAGEPEMLTAAVGLATIQTNAILALAYEQRTANLIAWLQPVEADGAEFKMLPGQAGRVLEQINERLGL